MPFLSKKKDTNSSPDLVRVTQSYEVLGLLVWVAGKMETPSSKLWGYWLPFKTSPWGMGWQAWQGWRSSSLWSPVTAGSTADTVLVSVEEHRKYWLSAFKGRESSGVCSTERDVLPRVGLIPSRQSCVRKARKGEGLTDWGYAWMSPNSNWS